MIPLSHDAILNLSLAIFLDNDSRGAGVFYALAREDLV